MKTHIDKIVHPDHGTIQVTINYLNAGGEIDILEMWSGLNDFVSIDLNDVNSVDIDRIKQEIKDSL